MAEALPARGRSAVEQALIQAAADLLAEVGPRAMSVRDVASAAGVNHGQVHHYFGSKDALIRAAMRELAAEHYEHAMSRAGRSGLPPALSLSDDERYWKAMIRLVVEGELDIARTEIDENISVPRHALEVSARRRGLPEPDLDTKVALASTTALQLGWVVLEKFVFMVADVAQNEEDAVRARVKQLAVELFQR